MGAINTDKCRINSVSPTNMLDFGFGKNEAKIHEAQKPLALIEYLIKMTTKQDQLVLDPFMGSGTTAVSATRLGRKYIGFEINPEFLSNALSRVEQVSSSNVEELLPFQQILFEESS